MPQRIALQRELNKLYQDLTKMGALIERQINDMIEALKTQDAELAREVIMRDDEIDDMELKIERACILLIARQQPLASDLRDIASVLKIITDLERIADHCSDISKYTINLSNENYVKPLIHIPEMVDKVKLMVKDTIDCTVKKDIELANKIVKDDLEINSYFKMIVEELVGIMETKPEFVRQCKEFLFIVKYLERMGDHSKNIAEWIIYNVTGKHI